NPPLNRPTTIFEKSKILASIPDPCINSPAKIKNGSDTSTNESRPVHIRCANKSKGAPINIKPKTPESPNANAIGITTAIRIKNDKVNINNSIISMLHLLPKLSLQLKCLSVLVHIKHPQVQLDKHISFSCQTLKDR